MDFFSELPATALVMWIVFLLLLLFWRNKGIENNMSSCGSGCLKSLQRVVKK